MSVIGNLNIKILIMDREHFYGTVTEAIRSFRNKGYTLDFNLDENCIICAQGKFENEDFEIDAFYRYEGDTDPADAAMVYAISSKDGHKGILVTGYGVTDDTKSEMLIKKLSFNRN
jgi:hypothetical protein